MSAEIQPSLPDFEIFSGSFSGITVTSPVSEGGAILVQEAFEEMSETLVATYRIAGRTRISVPTANDQRVTVTLLNDTLVRQIQGQIQGLGAYEALQNMAVFNGTHQSVYTVPSGAIIGVHGKEHAQKL